MDSRILALFRIRFVKRYFLSMKLAEYKDLIDNMPVSAHAFTCFRKNWASYFDRRGRFGRALMHIFGRRDEITLARSDLRYFARQTELDEFVVATILWGYPAGMRGENVRKIRESLPTLVTVLKAVREMKIIKWTDHCERLSTVHGVGLSTYTKFLAFLAARIDGHIALILDSRIADVAKRKIFDEMMLIQDLTYGNGLRWYPEYLRWIHSSARTLAVPAENLEFFLYEFGRNLKNVTSASEN